HLGHFSRLPRSQSKRSVQATARPRDRCTGRVPALLVASCEWVGMGALGVRNGEGETWDGRHPADAVGGPGHRATAAGPRRQAFARSLHDRRLGPAENRRNHSRGVRGALPAARRGATGTVAVWPPPVSQGRQRRAGSLTYTRATRASMPEPYTDTLA